MANSEYPYDIAAMHRLEGEARAAAHLLRRRVTAILHLLSAERESLDLGTMTAEQARRRAAEADLIEALKPYSETMDAFVEQLKANLKSTEEALHAEAVRGDFAMKECQLLNRDNELVRANSLTELDAIIAAISARQQAAQ